MDLNVAVSHNFIYLAHDKHASFKRPMLLTKVIDCTISDQKRIFNFKNKISV